MAMSRKHYKVFAEVIHNAHEDTAPGSDARMVVERIAADLCRVFREDNHAFDDARFVEACGLVK